MAAKTGKYVNRMKTRMRAYKFDYKDPITVLRFLAQLNCAYDSNGVPEEKALHVMPSFMKDRPVSSLIVRMTPREYAMDKFSLLKVGEERS